MPSICGWFSFRTGFSLLELVAVLALLGVGLANLIPAAKRQLDRMAVSGARDEVEGILHLARQEAVSRGSSDVILSTDPPKAVLISGEDTLVDANLGRARAVTIVLSRGRSEARLSFGPLGLGRVSSQTIRFERGNALATLVVSSLGRVVRR
jgi:prepilin-type N-terminal cleavage/methylation domain-containing protein